MLGLLAFASMIQLLPCVAALSLNCSKKVTFFDLGLIMIHTVVVSISKYIKGHFSRMCLYVQLFLFVF